MNTAGDQSKRRRAVARTNLTSATMSPQIWTTSPSMNVGGAAGESGGRGGLGEAGGDGGAVGGGRLWRQQPEQEQLRSSNMAQLSCSWRSRQRVP